MNKDSLRVNEDIQHLSLLALFHFVFGGLAALLALLPLIYVFSGLAMVSLMPNPGDVPVSPSLIGWFFVAMGAVGTLIGEAFAICVIVAGKRLRQHRSRIYCIVIAVILCTMIPFGTILGVFTIVVLTKPSVQALFGEQADGKG